MMTNHKHGRDEGQSESKAFETRDVKMRPLVVFIAGIAVMGVVSYLVIFVLFRFFSGQAAKQDAVLAPSSLSQPATPGEERLPPEPRIQANPAGDLKVLRDQEDVMLTTYGWVDQQAGVVRVPIDVAMKLVLEQGLPVRQPEVAPPAAGTPAPGSKPTGKTDPKKATR
jgi:hypothetical protein